MNDTPKIQWSKFSPDKSEQYVIRVDNFEELLKLKDMVLGELPTTRPFSYDEGSKAHTEASTQEMKVCPVHKTQLTWVPPGTSKQTGRPYHGFWACKERDEFGNYCKEGSKVAGKP